MNNKGAKFQILVRVTGIEPAHRKASDPKSDASASSATPAFHLQLYHILLLTANQHKFIISNTSEVLLDKEQRNLCSEGVLDVRRANK